MTKSGEPKLADQEMELEVDVGWGTQWRSGQKASLCMMYHLCGWSLAAFNWKAILF